MHQIEVKLQKHKIQKGRYKITMLTLPRQLLKHVPAIRKAKKVLLETDLLGNIIIKNPKLPRL